MMQIPINSVPNQTFSVLLNKKNCTINLNNRGSYMYIDLYVNNTPVILGEKCSQAPLIIYEYLATILGGNLIFVNTDNGNAYPFYTKFGITQQLIFFTSADIS
jgi:hypothetical protein